MGEVVGLGAMVQFQKMRVRRKRDKEMVKNAPEISLDELTEVCQVLACLVKGVYDRDKKGAKRTDKYWKSLGYEPVDLSVLAEEYDSSRDHDDKKVELYDRKVVGDLLKDRLNFGDLASDSKARLMLFKRIGEQVQPGDAEAGPREPNLKKLKKSEQKLPELVIAIRGTILSEVADVGCDVEIVAETLHAKKHSYMPIVGLIWAISRHYGTVDHVCVAGHSLGAALALQATRVLALNGVLLETHLFNPPNCSPDVLLKKGFTGVVNGVSDSMGSILGNRTRTAARDAGTQVAGIIDNAVKELLDVLPFVGGKVKRHKEEMNDEAQKLKLVGYAPYIYVNEKDPICNEYIKYFKPGEQSTPPSPPSTSTTAPLGELSPWTRWRSRSAHMVPRAHLFINHWAEGPSEAHRLHQWFLYPTVNLEEYVAKSDEVEV